MSAAIRVAAALLFWGLIEIATLRSLMLIIFEANAKQHL
jgi:hypothetical protein